ncbi:MAG: hypothetical protein H6Q33_5347 [Deltaproteobacteria bacterium]|nr:hypothetical protein [Deltaproteobacteria bacterium]
MAKYDKRFRVPLLSRVSSLWGLLSLVVLMGCDQQAVLDKFAPEVETKFARHVVDLFAAKNFSAIEAELAPELRQPDARSKFDEMARILPEAAPISVKTVGAHTLKAQDRDTYRLTFEYAYPDSKWVLVSTVLERRGGKLLLAGVHFQPLTQSLETQNRFTFEGKSPLHYVVLALAILVPLFVLYTLVICARTQHLKRKWLWLIFILLGVVQLSLNWTTGAWEVQVLSVLLFGAGFWHAGPSAPIIIKIAVPLGAIVFLLRQRGRRKAAEAT